MYYSTTDNNRINNLIINYVVVLIMCEVLMQGTVVVKENKINVLLAPCYVYVLVVTRSIESKYC